MEFISIIPNCEFLNIIIHLLKQKHLVFTSENVNSNLMLLLAVCPWISNLTPLCLNFFSSKIEVTVVIFFIIDIMTKCNRT